MAGFWSSVWETLLPPSHEVGVYSPTGSPPFAAMAKLPLKNMPLAGLAPPTLAASHTAWFSEPSAFTTLLLSFVDQELVEGYPFPAALVPPKNGEPS